MSCWPRRWWQPQKFVWKFENCDLLPIAVSHNFCTNVCLLRTSWPPRMLTEAVMMSSVVRLFSKSKNSYINCAKPLSEIGRVFFQFWATFCSFKFCVISFEGPPSYPHPFRKRLWVKSGAGDDRSHIFDIRPKPKFVIYKIRPSAEGRSPSRRYKVL